MQNEINASYSGVDELWSIERNLPNYNADIIRRFVGFAKPGARVLDFGAGIGTLSMLWKRAAVSVPECAELDPQLQSILAERGFVCNKNLEASSDTYDLIFSSNVLEHIEDDSGALEMLHAHLNEGGILALYLPVMMSLYSQMDKALGHYRRYEKSEVEKKLAAAHFELIQIEYVDSIGYLAWMYMKLFKRNSAVMHENPAGLRIYDKYIFPISKIIDGLGLKHLGGKNILVIARKSAKPN